MPPGTPDGGQPKQTGAAHAPKRGYDKLGVVKDDGALEYMTREQYENLPLADRVRLMIGGKLKFFRDGLPINPRDALRE